MKAAYFNLKVRLEVLEQECVQLEVSEEGLVSDQKSVAGELEQTEDRRIKSF